MTPSQEQRCEKCGLSLVPLKTFCCKRTCEECGKNVYVFELGEGGKGMQVRVGDRVVIPEGAIRISLDREQSTGVLSRAGISWFVQHLLASGHPQTPDALESALEAYGKEVDDVLGRSDLLKHLNLQDETQGAEAWEVLKQNQDKPEWWAALLGSLISLVRKSIAANDPRRAAWAMANLGLCRTMLIFKQSLEDTLWRGYTMQKLKDILNVWEQNKDNSSEGFWQTTLENNALILSQLFSHPVVILKGKAYVGGKGIDNTGGGIGDFLLTNALSDNAVLIEIKVPTTPLLGSEYRSGVYPLSQELSGAIAQVLKYKDSFSKEYYTLAAKSEQHFHSFDPRCLVIAGNLQLEIETANKRASFELCRNALRDVQVVTYDEVFAKVEHLVKLLGM